MYTWYAMCYNSDVWDVTIDQAWDTRYTWFAMWYTMDLWDKILDQTRDTLASGRSMEVHRSLVLTTREAVVCNVSFQQ